MLAQEYNVFTTVYMGYSHREKEDVLAEAGNCTLKLVHAFYISESR